MPTETNRQPAEVVYEPPAEEEIFGEAVNPQQRASRLPVFSGEILQGLTPSPPPSRFPSPFPSSPGPSEAEADQENAAREQEPVYFRPQLHRRRPHETSLTRPILSDRQLLELRQARALARLDTNELDAEITRRALRDPQGWGWIGRQIVEQGWVREHRTARLVSAVEHDIGPLQAYRWAIRPSRWDT